MSRLTVLDETDLTRNDFTQDYVSARAWAAGQDPYGPTADLGRRFLGTEAASLRTVYPDRRNPHLPAELVVVRPLTRLSYRAARVAWLFLMALCMAVGVALAARTAGWGAAASVVAGAGALATPVAQKDLLYGQINGLLVLLLVMGWRWARAGSDARAGIALGVATALKLFPALLVVPLLRQRRARAAAWQVGTAVVVSASAALAVGLGATGRFLTEAAPENFRFWRAAPMNLSLVAMPFRWLSRSVWRPDAPDVETLAAILALALLAACVVAAVRTPARLTGDPFWAAVPWMLLAIPLSWEFSLVLVLPALLLALARGPLPTPLILLAIAIVVIGIPPGLASPAPGNSIGVTMLGYGLPTYALVALGVGEWRRRRGVLDAPG